ncbi:MAG TPA: hypothetical protein VKS60_16130 [Stellaceae bacterium]|nr:hypothetical protein [Stellaceae bacterium]
MLSLLSGDFALNWQPVPDWVPGRTVLAYLSGAVLVAGGLGMLVPPTARLAALVVAVDLGIWLAALQVPRVASAPLVESMWLGLCETAVLLAGAWMASASLAASEGGTRIGRLFFAAALPLIGVSHFVYIDATAGMVPAWLPARTGLGYFTGAGHIMAGAGILSGILPRLAATLEAVMMGLFTVLIWLPAAATSLTSRFDWTALLVSSALTASAWIAAGSLQGEPWGLQRRRMARGFV